ncbi:MAG: Ig domain-containing protein, partial [Terriglobales bacterium]
PYTATITMNNGTGPFVPTLAQGTLPPGINAEASVSSTEEWLFVGTPTQAGTYHFSLLITDADGQTVTVPFVMTVEPFAITPAVLPTAVEGRGYLQTLAATGGVSPYSFQLVLGSLPDGLILYGNGNLAGVPTSGTAGTHSFSIDVTDSNGLSTVQAFTLTVFNPAALAVTTVALAPGTAGQQYSQPITADFGTTPYTFTILNGSLPSGVTLTPAGVLAGVPGAPGNYAFTIKVQDATGASATGHLSWTINPSSSSN